MHKSMMGGCTWSSVGKINNTMEADRTYVTFTFRFTFTFAFTFRFTFTFAFMFRFTCTFTSLFMFAPPKDTHDHDLADLPAKPHQPIELTSKAFLREVLYT